MNQSDMLIKSSVLSILSEREATVLQWCSISEDMHSKGCLTFWAPSSKVDYREIADSLEMPLDDFFNAVRSLMSRRLLLSKNNGKGFRINLDHNWFSEVERKRRSDLLIQRNEELRKALGLPFYEVEEQITKLIKSGQVIVTEPDYEYRFVEDSVVSYLRGRR